MPNEIRGHFPMEEDPSRQVPCIFCGEDTSTRAEAPGLGEGIEVPIHVLCSAEIVWAKGKADRGETIGPGTRRRLAGYRQRLGAGPASIPAGVLRDETIVDRLGNGPGRWPDIRFGTVDGVAVVRGQRASWSEPTFWCREALEDYLLGVTKMVTPCRRHDPCRVETLLGDSEVEGSPETVPNA